MAWIGPRPAQRPAGDPRVVTELVGFRPAPFDREVLEQALPLATAPFPGYLADPNHAALPAESQGLDTPLDERREHVHRIIEGLEHWLRTFPGPPQSSAHLCSRQAEIHGTLAHIPTTPAASTPPTLAATIRITQR